MAGKIVGRGVELTALTRFLDGLALRSGTLLLAGEAGIGKTLLWQEGLRRAEEQGIRVLAAAPVESEVNLSFSALGDLFAGAVEEVLPELPPPQRQALERSLLLVEATDAAPERRAVGVACLSALRTLARNGPVLVAVDDVQWLDVPSAAALEYVVRRLRDEPIGLLLTLRVEGPDDAPMLLERVLVDDRLVRLHLPPLSVGALFHVVHEHLRLALPRPALRRVHEASGGNPFYALELARALGEREAGDEREGSLPVPATIRELVRERIGNVSAIATEGLRVVALLADPTVPRIEAALGDQDTARRALEEAVQSSLLQVDGDRIRFSHPLLASGVTAELTLSARRALHRRLAWIVTDIEQRARHLALGAEGPDPDVARTLDEAAQRALLRGAPDTAAELCELAVSVTPVGDPLRARRSLDAVRHHYPAGNLTRLRELAEALASELPPGAQRAEALHWLAVSRGDDFRAAIELCERAREEAASRPDVLAQIEFFLSVAWLIHGDIERAAAHARDAVEAAERSEADLLVAKTVAQLSLLETWLARVTPGLLERGVALEETLGFPLDFFSSPAAVLGRRLMYAGDLDSARARFEGALRRALAHGDEPSHVAALLNLTELECRAGNWRRAESHALEGEALAAQIGSGQTLSALLYARALVAAHLGLVDEAQAAAEESRSLAVGVGSELYVVQSQAVLGFVALSRGDQSEADSLMRDLPDRVRSAGYRDPGACPVLPNAIEAAIGVGDIPRARVLLELLEKDGRASNSAWALAAAGRSRGLLAAAEGRTDAAIKVLEAALAEHVPLRMPFELARTLLALGTARRLARQKRAARQTLDEALALFESLEARVWVERARSELGRIGGRSAPRPGVLSATEARIAALVAKGRTNEEVAQALSLSPRTVEWHLSKVYRKLELRSRTELAASLAASQQMHNAPDAR